MMPLRQRYRLCSIWQAEISVALRPRLQPCFDLYSSLHESHSVAGRESFIVTLSICVTPYNLNYSVNQSIPFQIFITLNSSVTINHTLFNLRSQFCHSSRLSCNHTSDRAFYINSIFSSQSRSFCFGFFVIQKPPVLQLLCKSLVLVFVLQFLDIYSLHRQASLP